MLTHCTTHWKNDNFNMLSPSGFRYVMLSLEGKSVQREIVWVTEKLKTTIPGVNVLVVSFFPHMITILAAIWVFHFKYFCFARGRITKACLFYSLSCKKPPTTGTPTPKYLRGDKIGEHKDCYDYECPYFHQSLATPSFVFVGPGKRAG